MRSNWEVLMASDRFSSFEQFTQSVSCGRPGPWSTPIEDIADEMYQQDMPEEFEPLWDAAGSDGE